jgi:hypothetical protein
MEASRIAEDGTRMIGKHRDPSPCRVDGKRWESSLSHNYPN